MSDPGGAGTPGYEPVHTMTDWYDGPRRGVAELDGIPHLYESTWSDTGDECVDVFLLMPIDAETFALALEDWDIWLRWERASKEGRDPPDSHPALPEDRARHTQLEALLSERLRLVPEKSVKATADFLHGRVRWHLVED